MGTRTRTRRIIRILLAVVVIVPVWLVPLMPASASSITLTIKAAHHAEIDFTTSEKIFGKATTGGGAPAAGKKLILLADTFPYNTFRSVATTTTSSTGAYSFKRSPRHNTRYRVALKSDPTDRSPVRTVYVDMLIFDETNVGKATSVHVTFKLRYPVNVTEKGRPLYWYFGVNNASRLKHVSTTHIPAPVKPGLTKVSHTFRAPAGYSGYEWVVLWRDQPKHGLGRPVCLGPVAWDLGKSTCTPPKSVSAKTGL